MGLPVRHGWQKQNCEGPEAIGRAPEERHKGVIGREGGRRKLIAGRAGSTRPFTGCDLGRLADNEEASILSQNPIEKTIQGSIRGTAVLVGLWMLFGFAAVVGLVPDKFSDAAAGLLMFATLAVFVLRVQSIVTREFAAAKSAEENPAPNKAIDIDKK
jgi:hypothetical protein